MTSEAKQATYAPLPLHGGRDSAIPLALAALSPTHSKLSFSSRQDSLRSTPAFKSSCFDDNKENVATTNGHARPSRCEQQEPRQILTDITNFILSKPPRSTPNPRPPPPPSSSPSSLHPAIRRARLNASLSPKSSPLSRQNHPRSTLHRTVVSAQHKAKRMPRRNAISLTKHEALLLSSQLATPPPAVEQAEKLDALQVQLSAVRFDVIPLEKNLFVVARGDGHRFACSTKPSLCTCSSTNSQLAM